VHTLYDLERAKSAHVYQLTVEQKLRQLFGDHTVPDKTRKIEKQGIAKEGKDEITIKLTKSSVKEPSKTYFEARNCHAMAAVRCKLVLAGGSDDKNKKLADVWASDDNGSSWTQLTASAPFGARTSHAMAAVGGKLVLAGG